MFGRRSASKAIGALLLAAAIAPAEAGPATHTVTIEAMRFDPPTLTVKRGDRIVWVNKDAFPHTATAADGKAFDSKTIAAGRSWTHVARRSGTTPYVCTLHPMMKGTLVVQ